MAAGSNIWVMVLAMVAFHSCNMVFCGEVGIVYGRNGDNLPSPKQVTNFLTKDLNYAIPLIRVYDANLETLEALTGTNLVVTIGVPDEAIAHVASSEDASDKWAQDHILTYIKKGVRFRYVCVGNGAISGISRPFIQQAICNLHNSIRKAGVDYIHVTTAVGSEVLGSSYPPSTGQFCPELATIMSNLVSYLYSIGSPLLINVYPYYALTSDPQHISLDYALFQSQNPIVRDGNLEYCNLFDAMVDAFVAAMVRVVQKEDVKLVVAETGWPTDGAGPYDCVENARIYNKNLRDHVVKKGCTPRKADINLEVYVYEMFNENLKAEGAGQNFGTFHSNLSEVYAVWH